MVYFQYDLFRPAERTGEDLDIIYSRLKDLKAFEKFHPLLLQQICYYSYYEDLDQGVICKNDSSKRLIVNGLLLFHVVVHHSITNSQN